MFKCIPLFKGCNRQVCNCITPNYPFISITPTASQLCHHGFGWLCIIVVKSIIYQQLIMILRLHVNTYPGPGMGGLQLIFWPIYFIRVIIYSVALTYNISSGHHLPRGRGEGAYC